MAIATLEVGILIVATIEQFAVADPLLVEKILIIATRDALDDGGKAVKCKARITQSLCSQPMVGNLFEHPRVGILADKYCVAELIGELLALDVAEHIGAHLFLLVEEHPPETDVTQSALVGQQLPQGTILLVGTAKLFEIFREGFVER